MLLCFQTGMRCVYCGCSCHEKCAERVPRNCTEYKSVSDGNLTTQTLTCSGGDTGSVTFSQFHYAVV
jgi:myotubularin-related protein 5/13